MCDVISTSVHSHFKIGTQALRYIFDTSMHYYKQNNLDTSQRQPLGVTRQLNFYEPQIGEQVDIVKPYITSTGYCCWTRATFLAKENKKYTVKYSNT